MSGAPNQMPISFQAAPGRVAAVTRWPLAFVHSAPSATGPMRSTSSRPPAAIDSVVRRPTIAPAATSTRLRSSVTFHAESGYAREHPSAKPVEDLHLTTAGSTSRSRAPGGVDLLDGVELRQQRDEHADGARPEQRAALRERLGSLAVEALEEHRGRRARRELQPLAVDHVALHRDRHEHAERADGRGPRRRRRTTSSASRAGSRRSPRAGASPGRPRRAARSWRRPRTTRSTACSCSRGWSSATGRRRGAGAPTRR